MCELTASSKRLNVNKMETQKIVRKTTAYGFAQSIERLIKNDLTEMPVISFRIQFYQTVVFLLKEKERNILMFLSFS
jgi:hypothetical protein